MLLGLCGTLKSCTKTSETFKWCNQQQKWIWYGASFENISINSEWGSGKFGGCNSSYL